MDCDPWALEAPQIELANRLFIEADAIAAEVDITPSAELPALARAFFAATERAHEALRISAQIRYGGPSLKPTRVFEPGYNPSLGA